MVDDSIISPQQQAVNAYVPINYESAHPTHLEYATLLQIRGWCELSRIVLEGRHSQDNDSTDNDLR